MGGTPINHIGRYAETNAPVVVIDTGTGQRWPIWTEIDSAANDPAKRALEIYPAVNFASSGHYIVALRNVRNAGREEDRSAGCLPLLPRRNAEQAAQINAAAQALQGDLQDAEEGRHRAATTSTSPGTSRSRAMKTSRTRLLSIRNDAFAKLGDTNLGDGVVQGLSPHFKVNGPDQSQPRIPSSPAVSRAP